MGRKKLSICYSLAFRCRCHVLNVNKDNLGKFNVKSDEVIFLGYSITSKGFRMFDKKLQLLRNQSTLN